MKEKWDRNKVKILVSTICVLVSIIVYQSKLLEVTFPERAICIEHQLDLK